jgi:glycosyltransferase involved in cell wall biosynthesis
LQRAEQFPRCSDIVRNKVNQLQLVHPQIKGEKMAKLSFVVPTKDRLEWIGECLVSLMNQTEKDIEIVIVNDGSTDGTKEFLDDWAVKDPRVKVIHNETSLGCGKSRNIGAEAATGEIVASMDDDDEAPNDRAEATLRWFSEHPESELVNFPYVRVNYFGEVTETFLGSEFDYEGYAKTGNPNYFSNASAAMKKKSFTEVGGYPSETKELTDDYQFVKNWVTAGKKIDFDKRIFGVMHRVLPNSMMVGFRGWDPKWSI